jgi:hypothetical protein
MIRNAEAHVTDARSSGAAARRLPTCLERVASFIVRLRGRGVDTSSSRGGTDFVDYGDSGVFHDNPPDRCARSRPSRYRPAK